MIVFKEYDYTHPLLKDGNLRFQFSENGLLCGLKVEAELTAESLSKLIAHAPITIDDLDFWRTRPSGKLLEFKETISFDEFYACL